jgi:hypothetical protein
MTTKVDTLVDRYLTDLAAELRDLPANRRRELLDEVSQHIAEARATLEVDNEPAIYLGFRLRTHAHTPQAAR